MAGQRRAMAILFVNLFLVMLGFGVIIPVLPFYVRHYQGTATTLGLLMATYSVMQFFLAPIWGRISDRVGRRPVLLAGLSGYGISFILYGMATHLWMLFAARILAGVLSSATLPTTMAYITDITTDRKRAHGMGLMGGAMGLGIIIGPGLGGMLAHYSLALPFFCAGSLALLTLPFAWVMLPESMPAPGSSTPPRPRLSAAVLRSPLLPLFCTAFVVSFTMALYESTFAYFSADRFGFGPMDMGLMFAVLGVMGVVVQVGLLGRMVNRFGDVPVMLAGLTLCCGGMACLAGTRTLTMLWVFTAMVSLSSTLLRPSVATLVSKVCGPEKGTALGQMQSFDSLGRIGGPILGGWLYDLRPGGPYLLGALLCAAAVLLVWQRLRPALGSVPGAEDQPFSEEAYGADIVKGKRRYPRRHLIHYPRLHRLHPPALLGRLINLTPAGMLLQAEEPLDAGTAMSLRLELPAAIYGGGASLDLTAIVRWCTRDPERDCCTAGLELIDLPAPARQQIEDLLQHLGRRY